MSGDDNLKGVARDVRLAVASEEFDLAGYTETKSKEMFTQAFGRPLTAPKEAVQFTFVIGGGKLVRQKYSEELRKWISSALLEIGYVEDRGASVGSQGAFKHQHDTNLNLMKLIVFPNLDLSAHEADEAGDNDEDESRKETPEYIAITSTLSVFRTMVSSKVQSWRQKKRLLKHLQDALELYTVIEAKMCRGEVLSVKEQEIYDTTSEENPHKIAYLQGEIKRHIDDGRLSESEQQELVDILSGNLEQVGEELEKARKEAAAAARVSAIEKKIENMMARRGVVQQLVPILHRLKHSEDILKLRLRIFPLVELEEKGKSNSLTLKDLQTLEQKGDLEEAVLRLEHGSRGWFEDDHDFEARCAYELREAKAAYKGKQGKGSNSKAAGGARAGAGAKKSSVASASASAWTFAPSASVKSSKSSSKGTSNKAPSSLKGSNPFAAAFGGGSDSDSD